jgi:hypothetical protein
LITFESDLIFFVSPLVIPGSDTVQISEFISGIGSEALCYATHSHEARCHANLVACGPTQGDKVLRYTGAVFLYTPCLQAKPHIASDF